jgi:hypothetical protein
MEAAQTLDKLRKTMIPYFSGGLDHSQIQALNRKIECELYNALRSSSPQRVSLDLKSKAPEISYYKAVEKSEQELLHDLYHELGRQALLNF